MGETLREGQQRPEITVDQVIEYTRERLRKAGLEDWDLFGKWEATLREIDRAEREAAGTRTILRLEGGTVEIIPNEAVGERIVGFDRSHWSQDC